MGVRYRGHVKRNERGPIYWTECEITDCVPGEVFAFAVMVRYRAVMFAAAVMLGAARA